MMKYENVHISDGGNAVDEAIRRMCSLHETSAAAGETVLVVATAVVVSTMSTTNILLSKHFSFTIIFICTKMRQHKEAYYLFIYFFVHFLRKFNLGYTVIIITVLLYTKNSSTAGPYMLMQSTRLH